VWHREVVRWQTAGVLARLDTQATTVKQLILARLEAMAKHVNTEVSLQGVVPCQTAGATVRRDTQVLIVRQHSPAQLARTVNCAKTEVRHRGVAH